MKKFFYIVATAMLLLLGCTSAIAQTAELTEEAGFVIDLTTFTGIVALISALVTQIMKLIPTVKHYKLIKIAISVAVGIVICFIAWALKISPLLTDSAWWQVLIYGIAGGLSGCGFYDVIKALADLFKKNDDTETE